MEGINKPLSKEELIAEISKLNDELTKNFEKHFPNGAGPDEGYIANAETNAKAEKLRSYEAILKGMEKGE